jgi:hypothetical protein
MREQSLNLHTVFKPRFSIVGWAVSILLPGVLLLVLWIVWRQNGPIGIIVGLSIILGLFLAVSLFFLAIYPTMRYQFSDQDVTLICGPFRWSIPKSDIRSIDKVDLAYLPWSEGWKLPGYSMFSIHYGGEKEKIRMCSTAMLKRILLIRTSTDCWGVTPADPEAFIRAIKNTK